MTPDANDLCVFAIKRGNIEKRLDINYNLPQYAQLVSALRAKFGNKLMLDGIGARYTVKYHHRMAPLEYAVFESMRE